MIFRKSIEIYDVTIKVYYETYASSLVLTPDVITFSVNAHDFDSLSEKLKHFTCHDAQKLTAKGKVKDYEILKIEYVGFKYYFD